MLRLGLKLDSGIALGLVLRWNFKFGGSSEYRVSVKI